MPTTFTCPHCHKQFQAEQPHAGGFRSTFGSVLGAESARGMIGCGVFLFIIAAVAVAIVLSLR